jgi:hypothetical protein
MPTLEVHTARKEYPCSAPQAPCARRIERGRAYTQISYKPGEAPFKSSEWQILRACSVCVPIEGERAAAAGCPTQVGGAQCELTAGHHPHTDHQFPIGLF